MTMEFCERLKWAREKAGFPSPRAAAQAFGWNENTYKSHENGLRGKKDRPPSDEFVKKYAARFKVDFIWLLTGHGSPKRQSIAKVMGRIGAGAEISPEFEQVRDRIEGNCVLYAPRRIGVGFRPTNEVADDYEVWK